MTTAIAPTHTAAAAEKCTGCAKPLTADDLNYANACTDDRDEVYGDCCYIAHRDASDCGCLADERN